MKIKFHGFSRLSISGLITFYVFIGLFQSYNLDRRFCKIFHVGLILTSFVTHLPWTIFYVIFLTPFQYLNIIFSTKKNINGPHCEVRTPRLVYNKWELKLMTRILGEYANVQLETIQNAKLHFLLRKKKTCCRVACAPWVSKLSGLPKQGMWGKTRANFE
jgi:hypothetical protein